MARTGVAKVRFTRTTELGSGTYATVFKGVRVSDRPGHRREYAVKIIRTSAPGKIQQGGGARTASERLVGKESDVTALQRKNAQLQQKVDQLMREKMALDTFSLEAIVAFAQREHQHPSIITYYGLARHERAGALELILVMELAPCCLFKHLQAERPLEEKKALSFICQVLEGLDFLHNTLNIIHRDIKPGNILVVSDSRVKITDMGVSRFVPDAPADDFVGTRMYMAPEVISGSTSYEFRNGDRRVEDDVAANAWLRFMSKRWIKLSRPNHCSEATATLLQRMSEVEDCKRASVAALLAREVDAAGNLDPGCHALASHFNPTHRARFQPASRTSRSSTSTSSSASASLSDDDDGGERHEQREAGAVLEEEEMSFVLLDGSAEIEIEVPLFRTHTGAAAADAVGSGEEEGEEEENGVEEAEREDESGEVGEQAQSAHSRGGDDAASEAGTVKCLTRVECEADREIITLRTHTLTGWDGEWKVVVCSQRCDDNVAKYHLFEREVLVRGYELTPAQEEDLKHRLNYYSPFARVSNAPLRKVKEIATSREVTVALQEVKGFFSKLF